MIARAFAFHIDENVPEAVALGLRRRGCDVTTSGDAGLLAASDEDQIAYCLSQRRVMITHDSDMLRLAAAGIEHSGVCFCKNQRYKPGQLIQKLLAVASATTVEEMMNRIEYL